MLITTGFYAALLGIILLWLSMRVISRRRSEKVAHGDGGHDGLTRHRSAHSNFVDYVPLILILMATAESANAIDLGIHAIGIAAVAGRLIHAVGITAEPENFKLRKVGMQLTFLALAAAIVFNLVQAVTAVIGG